MATARPSASGGDQEDSAGRTSRPQRLRRGGDAVVPVAVPAGEGPRGLPRRRRSPTTSRPPRDRVPESSARSGSPSTGTGRVTQTAGPRNRRGQRDRGSRGAGRDPPPVSSRRRIVSCSTGSITTVMTRNWTDHSTVSGRRRRRPSDPAAEQLEAVGADGRDHGAGQHQLVPLLRTRRSGTAAGAGSAAAARRCTWDRPDVGPVLSDARPAHGPGRADPPAPAGRLSAEPSRLRAERHDVESRRRGPPGVAGAGRSLRPGTVHRGRTPGGGVPRVQQVGRMQEERRRHPRCTEAGGRHQVPVGGPGTGRPERLEIAHVHRRPQHRASW